MPLHRERRVLPFTQAQVFDLVADVERYPEFLPLWHNARVTLSPREPDLYITDQTLQLGLLQKNFRTNTRLRRPSAIEVMSQDLLFERFVIRWEFDPLPDDRCMVDFFLHCEARSLLLRPVLDTVLLQAAHAIVGAFERRARSLYGGGA